VAAKRFFRLKDHGADAVIEGIDELLSQEFP
jgi:hypothetical protein